MIVVYSSKSGSSEKYARALAERIGAQCFSVKDKIPESEPIVFFGWIRGRAVVGLNRVDRSRLRAVCCVGLDVESHFSRQRTADGNNLSVPIYYLRGWIDRSKLNIFDRTVLAFMAAIFKLRGLDATTQPLFDAMMEGGSFYDEARLEQVELFCRTSRRR